jgi:hypothetical protein
MQGLGGLASCTLQINSQNIDNSECFGVKFVKIYPEMTSQ